MTEQGDELLERLGPGRPDPMGSTLRDGGVNFAVFSDNAQAIELCIFDADGVRELKPAAIASDRRSVIRSPLRRAAEGSAGSSDQCFGRIQVDDELILARLLDRVEVLRLLAQAMPN